MDLHSDAMSYLWRLLPPRDRSDVDLGVLKHLPPPVEVGHRELLQEETARGFVVLQQHDVRKDHPEEALPSGEPESLLDERSEDIEDVLAHAKEQDPIDTVSVLGLST